MRQGFGGRVSDMVVVVLQSASFVLLLLLYLLFKATIIWVISWRFWGQMGPVRKAVLTSCLAILRALDIHPKHSISRLRLIDLSIRNMKLKKARSLVTVGGMAIGIGLIVLLISLGYGLQEVVVSRVARLEELKQTDVSAQPGGRVILDDKAVADFGNLSKVNKALPQIAVVGEVSYKSAVSDIAVYGVTTDYLEQSAVKVSHGALFNSRDLAVDSSQISQPTATPRVGESTEEATRSATVSVPLSSIAQRQAVINQSMVEVLGLMAESAVGETFSVSFVATQPPEKKIEGTLSSIPAEYTVVGVVSMDEAPYFYVPFVDLRSIGIDRYAQVRVVVDNQDSLAGVREQIEVMGYSTASAVDTVEQITSLFAILRQVLLVLGLGALFVASLGMFNTLTVSLLERTREVGLMKSMGMRSFEVRELFLTESMIMGLAGGILGLAMGWLAGKAVSVVISLLSLTYGQGVINVAVVPLPFALLIVLVAVAVGFLTGFYPARRATKISALNALRYE